MNDAFQCARRRAMAAFSQATAEELRAVEGISSLAGSAQDLRPSECGLVMIRGRIGGDGAPFNLGEATVARASVRLADGSTGHAYRLGRDTAAVRLAATADALWQDAKTRDAVEATIVAPVEARLAEAARTASLRAAATRVDFFTIVRGED